MQTKPLLFFLGLLALGVVIIPLGCLEDVCGEPETKKAAFTSVEALGATRIQKLSEALAQQGIELSDLQKRQLRQDGRLPGVVKLQRPVKHPDGTVEMPRGWLPAIPEGHPWKQKLTPRDEAYYSFVEERIFRAKLYDPENPEHVIAAEAYLARAERGHGFAGWTYAVRTECPKKPCMNLNVCSKFDAAVDAME
jgi:hypothetical protein